MATQTPRVGLKIEVQHDTYGKTYRLVATFQHMDDNGDWRDFSGWEYGYPYAYAWLTASSTGFDDNTGTSRRCMPDPVNYRNVYGWLNDFAIDNMARTFKRIDSAMMRDEKREGPAATCGQYYLRLARALGADCFILYDGYCWSEYDFASGCRRIDYNVRSWEYSEPGQMASIAS